VNLCPTSEAAVSSVKVTAPGWLFDSRTFLANIIGSLTKAVCESPKAGQMLLTTILSSPRPRFLASECIQIVHFVVFESSVKAVTSASSPKAFLWTSLCFPISRGQDPRQLSISGAARLFEAVAQFGQLIVLPTDDHS